MFARFTSSEFVPFLNTHMEAQAEHAKIKRYNTLYTITTVLGVALVVLTFIWLNHYLGGFSLDQTSTEFNWHPLLMVTGMLFLYSQSILVYRTGRNTKKFTLKCIHAGLHITILIMAALGLKAVFDSHNYASPPIANLYSLHSWLGILTFALFCGQLVIGFTTFLFPGASKGLRTAVLPYHVTLGSAGFLMSVITAGLGYAEKVMFFLGANYQKLPLSGTILNLIGVVTVIFGLLTLHLVNDVQYEREEVIEDEVPLSGE
ncbi:transmembrane ascorbate-dependent reductase CYB561-like isoform X2 [Coccinella septempunctata]|uniref:transmembrane ascorbate-dependent reductase CYB561-like isoform X2 n=1 Tax=Coccinella septempunctata TaxID=41139 RepID=UPI001D08A88C|nr:transmembrane ascorbate-dependent reductase CYB561-like isoform X2 [Coccinella septempunctata]